MTGSPHTYGEWVVLLERFRDGDDATLEAMAAGSVTWSPVVAERFTRRVSDAFVARLQAVSRQLQRALDRAGCDSFAVSEALLAARRALRPLAAAASVEGFPEAVRTHLAGELASFVLATQSSLERSAGELFFDSGAVLKALRDNPLRVPQSDIGVCPPMAGGGRGRRVLI